MSYDINLKKTQLGYQFDRNVYIGYQTNDNRVVTVKELKGLNITGGGGGGGGGGIQSIVLTSSPAAGTITLTVDGSPTEVAATNVVADSSTPSGDTPICVIAQNGNSYTVYSSGHTWSEVPSIAIGGDGDILVSVTTGSTTTVLTLGAGLTKSTTGTTTTLSIASNVVRGMSIDGAGLHYQDGSGTHDLGGTIGTTSVGVLSIATSTSQSPSSSALVSVGYLEEQYQGGNVYSTEDTPDGQQTSDKNTRFIFVEVE